MSELWTPGKATGQEVRFDVSVMPDTTIVIRCNGLSLPALPAEQIQSLAMGLSGAAVKAIAMRIPEPANGTAVLSSG